MLFYLLQQSASNTPANNVQYNLQQIIYLLFGLIIVLVIVLTIVIILYQRKLSKVEKLLNAEINKEERDLLLKYRNLNNRDKSIIDNTLTTLNKNTATEQSIQRE